MHLFRQLQPALAALLAACVMLLGLAGASPTLHRSLCDHPEGQHAHHAEHDHADYEHHAAADDDAPSDHSFPAPDGSASVDHACAVTLFASGCTSFAPVSLSAPPVLNATSVAHFTELMLARTLRGPARVCGPPALA